MLPQTMNELDAIRDECYAMVTKRAALSAGASVVPAIGVDAAADVAILMELIPAISRRFGVSSEQVEGYNPAIKQMMFQLIKRAGLAMVGMEVTRRLVAGLLQKVAGRVVAKQALKLVPVVGWAVNGAIGFGAMKYVGNSHVDDCYAVCKKLIEQHVFDA